MSYAPADRRYGVRRRAGRRDRHPRGIQVITILVNLVSLLALPDFVQLIVRGVVVVLGVALYSRRTAAARV